MMTASACCFGSRRRPWGFPVVAMIIGLLLLSATPGRAAETDFDIATQKLFAAVHANDLQAAQASVAAGANLSAKDRWGMSAIDLAIDKGYFSIAHFLTSTRNLRRHGPSPAPVDRVSLARQTPAAASEAPAAAPAVSQPTTSQPAVPKSRPGTRAPAPASPIAAASPAAAADRPNPFDPKRPAPGATLPVVGAETTPPPEAPTAAPLLPSVEPSPVDPSPADPSPATRAGEGNWADAKSPGFALTDTLEPPMARPTPRPAPSRR